MTTYHDPSRPKIASGVPTFTSNSQVMIPRLILNPSLNPNHWEVEIFLSNGKYASTGTTIHISNILMIDFLIEWRDNPEGALQKWFNLNPPSTSSLQTTKTLDELGL